MFVRNQRAKTKQHHGSSFGNGQLTVSANRIGRIAFKTHVTQIEYLTCGNSCFGTDLVTVVEQHARADVEPVAQRLDVHHGVGRPQLQSAIVDDAVVLECVSEVERVEACTEVKKPRHGNTELAANA